MSITFTRFRSLFCGVVLSAFVSAVCLSESPTQAATSSGSAQAATTTGTPPPASTKSGTAVQPGAPAQPTADSKRPRPVWQGAQANRLSRRAEMYYQGVWGVGELHVKVAESGELVRFDYQVFDPAKAAVLSDKKAEPALYDAQARVKLSIPQMEKVGKLRQASTPKAGMSYWMAFSNPTLAVKRGDRVDVVIGSFRAANLVVE